MHSSELKDEINWQLEVMAPLQRRLEFLDREYDEALSREWIAANDVKLEDVYLSSGHDIPLFRHVWEYGAWLRAINCLKRWGEWNGRIYPMGDLKAGNIGLSAPGRLEHVPE